MDVTTLVILAVIFLATLIRSAFGFGEALVAVPLLALVMPVEEAAPLAVLVSIAVAALILAQDWRKVHFASAGWLLLATFLGIPVGLLLLTGVEERLVKGLLGSVIVGFSSYFLAVRRPPELKNDLLAPGFGFLAGVLGGAYGMNGPPLVIYGSLRRWAPEHFRATLQGYFLPASLAGMFAYWCAGLWTARVSDTFLLSSPAVLAAVVLGRMVNRRLAARRFLVCVHLGLIVVGFILWSQTLAG